jgi:hypothetical protein
MILKKNLIMVTLILLAVGLFFSCESDEDVNGPTDGNDTIEALIDRYETAINSHDTLAVAAVVANDFIGTGWDKTCYLNRVKELFTEYPSVSVSINIIDTIETGDISKIITDWAFTNVDNPQSMNGVDTIYVIRRSGIWYIWGDRILFDADAFVVRFSSDNEYYVEMLLDDPGHRAISVNVSGTGISPPQPATFQLTNQCANGGRWWGVNVSLGSPTPPPLPAAYNFEAITADSTYNFAASANEYFSEFAEPIFPMEDDTVNSTFTFMWHLIPGLDSIAYGIQLDGHFWQVESDSLDDTTLVYNGTALTSGQHSYLISAKRHDGSAHSLQSASFYVQ